MPADSSMRLFVLPAPAGVPGAYFVDLRLTGPGDQTLSTNFYWLSNHPDVLADTSTWYVTPVKSFADYTALTGMPRAVLKTSARFSSSEGKGEARVTLSNPGKSIAFFTRLQVVGRGGEEALPVFWSDNYVSLLPGETRVLTASYATRDLHGAPPRVRVSGWNVTTRVVKAP
jgi:exo-1,4-beta-D-glucosaminidase